jgi:energy-coupling factor transporter ATP-binding protein EcfA2
LANAVVPVRIEIVPNGPGYKSIQNLIWDDVPEFAIVTGRNGSGKTQLLEVLAYHLTGTSPPPPQGPLSLTVSVQNIQIDADEVGFVPSAGRFSGGGSASLAQMQSLRTNLYQQVQNRRSFPHDPAQTARARRTEKRLAGRDWQKATKGGQFGLDEDEFNDLLVDVDVSSSLATIFVAHRLKLLEGLERGTPGFAKDGEPLGPAPWDVVNESLEVAGFPYRVVSPLEVAILDHYELRLRDQSGRIEVRPSDLSSGEQVLLQLNLWLFSSGKEGVFPKLLLLDEPDAHLHPSMTVQFLDVISEVLVRKHGVRVIMSTHSPSTVALAPEGAVFQMERGGAEVLRVTDRPAILSVLTAGLVTVSRATRFCFVEDEDDVAFYNALLEILTDAGPSKDPCAIRDTPSLVFIAASVGRGPNKVAGGKTIVEKWVQKLDAPPLTTTFCGVLDRDTGNQPTDRIKVIGRYSFENYLLDPINVFGLLLENGSAPAVSGVTVTSGDEHNLRTLPAASLQAISDTITAEIENKNPSLIVTPRAQVEYTRGAMIEVPKWVVHHRGHDLLPIYQGAWGGHQLVTPRNLTKALRRVRLVPKELAALMSDLQS